VIQRKTQTPEYWQEFRLTQDDMVFIHDLLLEAEHPLATQELAVALVGERCRREEAELRAELAQGKLYQPRNRYAVGDKLIFPALDFRLGQVVSIRPGRNPEYDPFDVITVDFGPGQHQRSFAAGLEAPHKLNAEVTDLLGPYDVASPEKLLQTVASHVPEVLRAQLAQWDEVVSFEDRWMLRGMLADIHIGHLNIAEALIEMRGAPVDTGALLKELDLPAEINPDILTFSIHAALARDDRFDQVGPDRTHRWFLRRLEPPEALEIPVALRYQPISYERDALPVELLQLEWELDDEWTEAMQGEVDTLRATIPSVTLTLTYPHRVSGTLPLNHRARSFFPTGSGERTMVQLVDGRWGQQFLGWVVREGRYVAGLRSWFDQHKLPAGAYITLTRQEGSNAIVVDFRPRRMRREWARWGQVVGSRLDIQLRKQEVACEYDEQMIISTDQLNEIFQLRSAPPYAEMPLADLVYELFVDLAGLSQGGQVHAKTIYSTVNVLRRCPPGPIFAVLATDPRFQSVGQGFYRLAE